MENLEKLRYPIGRFNCPEHISEAKVKEWILSLETFPDRLEATIANMTQDQLETPYRPGGWTVRQLVHHLADSHHHSYTRFKWALTENNPVIKAYKEKAWADLLDAHTAPVAISVNYLKALHTKLVFVLKKLSKDQLTLCFIHPADNSKVSLAENIGKYAWHGNHHLAHIQNLKQREGWM
ncbi:YfiT family bacillithiol transferase [Maribacter chungangensis]|uniref:YfiT family bacillithiol transferase n=1 Tax=Maribacter chungangensis TaxID=1069117 RepID=A0ABW3B1C7_9FLAO